MDRKSASEETQGLSADDLCDHRPKMACADLDVSHPDPAGSRAGEGEGWEYFLDPSYARPVGAAASLPLLETIFSSRSPGAVQPGFFFEIRRDRQGRPGDENSRRNPSPDDADAEQFHDSELGDIYDLYNACNGVMRGNVLDVRKLKELSAEELEVLDVKRLEEVWHHTDRGCVICARIVRTLNEARSALRAGRKDAPKQ
jgi:hypothetical protein